MPVNPVKPEAVDPPARWVPGPHCPFPPDQHVRWGSFYPNVREPAAAGTPAPPCLVQTDGVVTLQRKPWRHHTESLNATAALANR